jgi:phosphatidylglycerol:prolipoprotein diacylglycerol transferase
VPLLTIEIPWSPTIATLGGFVLTWHGLFTALGILAGVQLALRMARVVRYDPDQAYTLALVGVPSGIIGARLLFIVEHWDFYRGDVGQILALNQGGISVWGAVLGGVLGSWLFALWRKYPIGRGLDISAFGFLAGLAIGRLGDLVNGEHLGRATDVPWAVVYTHPESPAFAHSITVSSYCSVCSSPCRCGCFAAGRA